MTRSSEELFVLLQQAEAKLREVHPSERWAIEENIKHLEFKLRRSNGKFRENKTDSED
jgi:hypothetical protein